MKSNPTPGMGIKRKHEDASEIGEDIKELIVTLYKSGESIERIARKVDLNQTLVKKILSEKQVPVRKGGWKEKLDKGPTRTSVTAYHGSPTTSIREFKIMPPRTRTLAEGEGIYLTEDIDVARSYSGDNGSVYKVTIDTTRMFDATNESGFLEIVELVKRKSKIDLLKIPVFEQTLELMKDGQYTVLGENGLDWQVRVILENDERFMTKYGEARLRHITGLVEKFLNQIKVMKYLDPAISELPLYLVRDGSLITLQEEIPGEKIKSTWAKARPAIKSNPISVDHNRRRKHPVPWYSEMQRLYEKHKGNYNKIAEELGYTGPDRGTLLRGALRDIPWAYEFPAQGTRRKRKFTEDQVKPLYKLYNGNYKRIAKALGITEGQPGTRLANSIKAEPWAYKYPPKGKGGTYGSIVQERKDDEAQGFGQASFDVDVKSNPKKKKRAMTFEEALDGHYFPETRSNPNKYIEDNQKFMDIIMNNIPNLWRDISKHKFGSDEFKKKIKVIMWGQGVFCNWSENAYLTAFMVRAMYDENFKVTDHKVFFKRSLYKAYFDKSKATRTIQEDFAIHPNSFAVKASEFFNRNKKDKSNLYYVYMDEREKDFCESFTTLNHEVKVADMINFLRDFSVFNYEQKHEVLLKRLRVKILSRPVSEQLLPQELDKVKEILEDVHKTAMEVIALSKEFVTKFIDKVTAEERLTRKRYVAIYNKDNKKIYEAAIRKKKSWFIGGTPASRDADKSTAFIISLDDDNVYHLLNGELNYNRRILDSEKFWLEQNWPEIRDKGIVK